LKLNNCQISIEPYLLNFKFEAGTSRGILKTKQIYILKYIFNNIESFGEATIIPGLSLENPNSYKENLYDIIDKVNSIKEFEFMDYIEQFPSIAFALEMIELSQSNKIEDIYFPSEFTNKIDSIPINGLVWMNNIDNMYNQAKEKLEEGYKVIKIKVGALDFNQELNLIKKLRLDFGYNYQLRLDANGGFSPSIALERLKSLSEYDIHSIEQPIAVNQIQEMANLVFYSPIPIALDEELIGKSAEKIQDLSETIKPSYFILKPSLLGGFKRAGEIINLAKKTNIKYWVTSALESNIGLNAIAQFTYQHKTDLAQGLGTGGLYTNNTSSHSYIKSGNLFFD